MLAPRVLIVENEPDIAGFYQVTLELEGFQCEVARSAKEALLHLTTNVPDLILLDLNLGGEINGQDILYQVRINPLFENTRVVVATAHPQVARLVSHLADLVLLKPVDAQQLRTLSQRITSEEYDPRLLRFIDPVTRMYNEMFFNLRLEHAHERSRRRNEFIYGVILLRLEVSGLPEEPDEQLDEDAVTDLYQQIAHMLRLGLRTTDTVTRLANWKFAVLLEELKSPDDIQVVVERMRAALANPLQVGEQFYPLKVYIAGQVSSPQMAGYGDLLAAVEAGLKQAESL